MKSFAFIKEACPRDISDMYTRCTQLIIWLVCYHNNLHMVLYQVPRFVYVPIPYNYSIYLRYIWILGYTTSYVFSYCLTIFAKTCCLILWILLENHLYCVLTYVMYVLHPKIESIGQELWMNCQIRRIWVFEKAQFQNDFNNSKKIKLI